VTTAYSKRDRLKIYLYAQSPNGLELLAQESPRDDGLGGSRTATLHWTIAMELDYYLLVWMEQGSASFTVSAMVTRSPAGPLPSLTNCLDSNVDQVLLRSNAKVDSVVIAGTRVDSGRHPREGFWEHRRRRLEAAALPFEGRRRPIRMASAIDWVPTKLSGLPDPIPQGRQFVR
jgi:hypothetical protein